MNGVAERMDIADATAGASRLRTSEIGRYGGRVFFTYRGINTSVPRCLKNWLTGFAEVVGNSAMTIVVGNIGAGGNFLMAVEASKMTVAAAKRGNGGGNAGLEPL